MSRWFRVYDDLVDDPKVQRLSGEMVKSLLNLWCLASQNDGTLPAADDIAFKLRMTPTKVAKLLSVLGECGLIDSDETGLRPHNWSGRQYKSDVSNERVKRFRERKCNVTSTVTATPPETEQIQNTDSETEQKDKSARTRADDWPENFGDLFWQAYPRKEEKISAMKKLAAIRKSGIVTFADLIAGVKRYCDQQREPQFTKQPTVWLNKGCWADEHQTGTTNGQRSGNTRASGHDAILAAFTRKAREIVGDGPMAGTDGEDEFSWGNGTQSRPAERTGEPPSIFAPPNERRASGSRGVLEGEIIPPDEPASRIPGSRH
jgi:DNA-binding transcriptional ArsR family regulator